MFARLFINEWKETIRSPYLSTSLIQKIGLGILALYLLLNFLAAGIYLDKILLEVFPSADVIVKLNGFLLYYFLFDIVMRFFMQSFPVVSIKPYLTLPIKRSSIIHFLILKSVPSFFNLLPLLLFVPFFVKVIIPTYSIGASIAWFVTLLSLILMSNFISFYLKKAFDLKPLFIFVFIALISGLFYLDSYGYVGLAKGMENVMGAIFSYPLLALIPFGLAIVSYMMLYRFFRARIYLDALAKETANEVDSTTNLAIFNRFGKIGEMMNLEMKMIWRNARSRTFLYLSIGFLLYPFLIINSGYGIGMKIMFAILTTGMFAFNYAQLLLSWHSTHFDYILTRNIKAADLFKSKYYLMSLSVLISYILTLPFCFIIDDWFMISTMSMLFNIGVSIYMYIYIANYNSKKIDPSKGNTFNFEGFGAAHYFIMIPIILAPILIYLPFSVFGYANLGMAAFGFVGIFGFLFRRQILGTLIEHFEERKHTISSAFRNQ